MMNAKELMRQSVLFQGMDDGTIENFLSRAETVSFAAGDIPVAEATITDRIAMVVEGELRISVELLPPDPEVKFLNAVPGTFLGLLNFFNTAVTQPCTVTAVTDVQALAWKAEDWRKLAESNPALGYQLSQRIGHEVVERMAHWINNLLNTVSWGV
jgi:CRP-like cAMP-binding protein